MSAAANPAAQEVILSRAAERNARAVRPDSFCRVSRLRSEDGFYSFAVAFEARGGIAGELEISLPLAGRYQVSNALTAITAARLLAERGFPVDGAAITRGLASVSWPGRLERVHRQPALYLDGTHNPAGARELAAFWEEHLRGRRIHLIYGAMRDKAVDEIAGLLFPRAATVILTQSPQPRSISAEALAGMTGHLAQSLEVVPDPAAALERALELASPEDAIFAAGSLYLAGDLRRYWQARLPRQGAQLAFH